MADGVAITAGSGTTIWTDDTASGHKQIMGLGTSGNGDTTLIPATTDGLGVVVRPETAGGLSAWSSTSDLDETEEEIKATAGQVYSFYFNNKSGSARTLKFYANTAAGTTVGTTTPLFKYEMNGSTAGHIAIPQGVAFATGICVAATTGYADADTGAPAANDVTCTVFYK
jgi:hypothetical protein